MVADWLIWLTGWIHARVWATTIPLEVDCLVLGVPGA